MDIIGIVGYKETNAWALIHEDYGQVFVSKDELEVRFIKLYLEDDILVENWTPQLLEQIVTSLYNLNYRSKLNLKKGEVGNKLSIEALKNYRRVYVNRLTNDEDRDKS